MEELLRIAVAICMAKTPNLPVVTAGAHMAAQAAKNTCVKNALVCLSTKHPGVQRDIQNLDPKEVADCY
jgi:hypothetical protein